MSRRRGRKRKPGVKRQPAGHIASQTVDAVAQREAEIVNTVLMARERVYRLTAAQAVRMTETSVLGRLEAVQALSRRQYEALVRYRGICRAYDRAMHARRLPSPSDYDRIGGHDPAGGDDPAYVGWVAAAVAAYDACRLVLAGCADPMARAAVNAVALSDLEVPHLIGSVRIGANALAGVTATPGANIFVAKGLANQ